MAHLLVRMGDIGFFFTLRSFLFLRLIISSNSTTSSSFFDQEGVGFSIFKLRSSIPPLVDFQGKTPPFTEEFQGAEKAHP